MISKRLQSFILTVQEGTISKAAEKLFTTPSPLSRQIKLLEEEVGFNLFIRSNNGMKLTDKGIEFYEKVLQAYNLLLSFTHQKPASKRREILMNNIPTMHACSLSTFVSNFGYKDTDIIEKFYPDSSPDFIVSTSPYIDNDNFHFFKYVESAMSLGTSKNITLKESDLKKLPIMHSSSFLKYHGAPEYLEYLEAQGFTGGFVINDCFLARIESIASGHSMAIFSWDFFNSPIADQMGVCQIDKWIFHMGYWVYNSYKKTYCEDIISFYNEMHDFTHKNDTPHAS